MKNLNNKNKKLKFGFAVGIFIVTIIISLLALYYIHQFAMDRNWAVTRLFVHCPFHLRYLLILLGSILLSLLPVILLNMRRTWRKRILNKEVLWFLRSYIAVNPTGSRYIAVRHIGHGIAGLLLFWLPLLLKAVIPPISKASKYL
ncbi:MAG: hypothetical protein GY757_03215, partial [bacterium]|nr:hypothetical protein [bacterium]